MRQALLWRMRGRERQAVRYLLESRQRRAQGAAGEDDGMSFDQSYQVFLWRIAKHCKCCPICSEVPCGGCQQGAPCDAMPCRCDDHDDGDESDDDYDDTDDA